MNTVINIYRVLTKKDSFSAAPHEPFLRRNDGIQREKQIKGWVRKKKVALIESLNPEWKDLYDKLDQRTKRPFLPSL